MSQIICVSHVIEEGMKTYPGLPEPRAEIVLDREASRERFGGKAEFFIASLHVCGNTGTYVDAPFHRFADGVDLADLPLEKVADVPAVLVDARELGGARGVGPEAFDGIDVAGKAVLVLTGFSRHWRQERYFKDNPFLTRDACKKLVAAGARLVGIDSLNIDDVGDLSRPAHTELLGAGIPVCEHMTNLERVPESGGRLHAAPIAWRGGATFPVRAYVIAP